MEASITLLPPQTDIVLPQPLLKLLKGARLPHAVLLIGSVNDTRDAARYLAQVLLCIADERPCGTCPVCLQFASGSCTDFFEAGGESIRKGDVEMLQHWLPVKGHGATKVYSLYGAHTMTGVAANRILKTLEEPHGGVHAILTASSRHAVLSTIRSRSSTFTVQSQTHFSQSDFEVIPLLQSVIHPEENDLFDGFVDKMVRWTQMWLVHGEPSLILAAELQSLAQDVSAEKCLIILVEWFRDILYTRIGQSDIRFHEWSAQIEQFAPMLEIGQWTRALNIVIESRLRLRSNVVALLNFEQMCIRLQGVSSDV